MNKYLDVILDSYFGYWTYLKNEILFTYDYKPWYENYFYWLIALSIIVWLAEITLPWRQNQKAIRKDFWLDGFYLFFNFFLFSLILYNALSNVAVELFNNFIGMFGFANIVAIEIGSYPSWLQLLILFVVVDFIHWNIHRLLHRIPFLWEIHKVHHSVKEMGFAAHLRFHWMESIIYKSLQFIPLSLIGFGIDDFFLVHIVALLIGHLNHANLNLDYGPFKYVLNNPKMHIWHHAKKPTNIGGANFGISLSVWDYIFKTAYIPESGRDIELGFNREEEFPPNFLGQARYPFGQKKY